MLAGVLDRRYLIPMEFSELIQLRFGTHPEAGLLRTFALALAIGLLIGLERERHAEPVAGLRTFGLTGLLGAICAMLAFVLILPIPLGNLLPALTIGFFGFALFSRDGIFAIVGYLLAGVSALLLYLAADVVIDGVRLLVNWLGAA